MSWTPSFWIYQHDFNLSVREKLKTFDRVHEIKAWEFTIANRKGVVFGSPATSNISIDLHELIQDVPHWILDGECMTCPNCIVWGNRLNLEYL